MADKSVETAEDSAKRVIIILLLIALAFAVFSVSVIYSLVHNLYAASYYTMAALFGSNAESSQVFIAAAVSGNVGTPFYVLMATSIIDGLAKAAIIAFIIAAFINMVSSIDIKSKLTVLMSARRMKGHVVVCGYSMLAERLIEDLNGRGIKYLVIDKSQEKTNLLKDLNIGIIEGDFTDREILDAASVRNARTVVFATESDFVNLLGIVTLHHMYPEVRIITRARFETSVRKMERGGATMCLVPEVVAGMELGETIARI